MKTKEHLLCMLENNRDAYLSGETLARSMGISRNAVWKAINALRSEGYEILAITNKGYQLSQDNDLLSCASIERDLEADHPFSLIVRKTVGSTNIEARKRALDGALEGTVVVAEEQTAGRGRRGKMFYSPAQTGVYLSIVLYPTLNVDEATRITTAAAVAGAQTIEQLSGKEARIKWVNDIYCEESKVAGILTEGSIDMESGCFSYAIMGIGFNVSSPTDGFPEEISERAGSIFDDHAGTIRSKLVARFLQNFWALYQDLLNETIYYEYRKRCFLIGQPIMIEQHETSTRARAIDLTPDFKLVVEFPDKTRQALAMGEVSTSPA